MSKRLIIRANLAVFGVLIAFIALIGALTWHHSTAGGDSRRWTLHTYEVITTISELGLNLRDAEIGERSYLLTGETVDLEPYQSVMGKVSFLQGELQRLTADNSSQQDRLRTLSPILQHRLELLAQAIQLRRDSGLDAAMRVVNSGAERTLTSQVRAALTAMAEEEYRLLTLRIDTTDNQGNWVRYLVAIGVALAVLAMIWAARLLNNAWAEAYAAEQEQRNLAERLNISLHSLSQGVGVFGPAHKLRHSNDCFKVLLRLPPEFTQAGTPYSAIVGRTAADGTAVLETEEQVAHGVLRPGEPIVSNATLADGCHLEIRRTPMPDGGFVLTISDMTKRVQAEAVLREVQKMQALGQLTGGIAHDFNNLLTVIIGNLDLARMKLDPQNKLVIHIERALWAAQRGGTLTSQLLAFARKQPLAPTAIDLAANMPELVPLLRRTLGEHIDIRFVDSAGLWPAMADPAQLESALLNLALNARDAMPGGGRLTIELANKMLDTAYASSHAEVEAGDYVMLAVTDTGHGMTPETMARVFEPFFTTKTDGRGTGLGLAMVFGFVKQSGGHVKVYSEPGEGTSVKLYLPRAIGGLVPNVQRSVSPADLPCGSATILVVEDEAGVREVAVAILRSLGYRVFEAADGDAGLLMFGAHAAEIELLLTDVVLPGKVRGRELAERVTAMRPEVKVLFMSGYTENAIVHHGRLDDGVQLLSKPFKREQLARKVAEVLTGSSTAAEQGAENVVDLRGRKRD